MTEKPTYEELELRVRQLEAAASEHERSAPEHIESRVQLQSLFHTMAEGVVLIAPDGRIVQANPAAKRILGLARSEILQRDYTAPDWRILRLDGTTMPPEEMAGSRVMKARRPVRGMVMGVEHPDRTVAWINVSAAPLFDSSGEFDGVVATFTDITEHQRDKEKLRLFKRLLDASHEAFAVSDAAGQLVYINPAHERLFGRSFKEARQMNYRDYYPPESIAVLNEMVAPALERGENWEGVLEAFDAGGRRFPLWEHAGSIRNEQGQILYGFGIMHDETERRRAEEALRESEERFSILAESTDDVFWDWDLKTGHVRWSDSIYRTFGYSRSQVQPTEDWWKQRIHPEDRQRVIESVERAMRSGKKSWQGRYRYQNADGSYAWILDRGAIVYDDAGNPIRMLGAEINLTTIVELEHQLYLYESKYRLLTESSPSGIWVTDSEGHNTYVSSRWSEITGISRSQALGDGWSRGVHSEDRDRVRRGWYETAPTGTRYESEFRFVKPDGKVIWVLCTAVPVRDEQGDVTEWIGTITDITKLKLQEAALQQTAELLHQKASEIKTLERILPTCQHCRRIRKADNSWVSLEFYIVEHTHADFSHGICPDCVKKYYPDYDLS